MHPYRTHKCNELTKSDVDSEVRLSGWIHRKRDHGGVLFIDLRDTYGITQCVTHEGSPLIDVIDKYRPESVITVTGKVIARSEETVNPKMATGEIEVLIEECECQSAADAVPIQVADEDGAGEEVRLKHRYLDLRKDRMQRNIRLRNDVIAALRDEMRAQGFQEFQTPILTASSPEGARDFLVPARQHPGKFYALPQAPQQFKQLLMMSGFDRYFQIAPCFRDEDARADRSPGEFYQLDMEMSFVEQEDVFGVIEPVMVNVFEKFAAFTGQERKISEKPFPRIPYREAMEKYGTDKPDLRNPIEMFDASDIFMQTDFAIFKSIIEKGGIVKAIPAKGAGEQPRSWFDKLGSWAQSELQMPAPPAYIVPKAMEGGKIKELKGPLAKFLESKPDLIDQLFENAGFDEIGENDAIFFVASPDVGKLNQQASAIRTKLGTDLGLSETGVFRFCWIVDFPMFEYNEDTQEIEFSHNPFSMPQGGLKALEEQDPLDILAWQYDIVCNGVELSSGAIRNHRPDIMEKAFDIAGYSLDLVEEKFGGMFNAFKYGAPPHGGIAPGVDRIVMLIADEPSIREVIAFPMNGAAEDPLMGAPGEADPEHLKELHIKTSVPKLATTDKDKMEKKRA